MQATPPEPLTDEQRRAAERLVSMWTNWLRLTRMGAGGLSQLRREFEAERSRVLLMIQADDAVKEAQQRPRLAPAADPQPRSILEMPRPRR